MDEQQPEQTETAHSGWRRFWARFAARSVRVRSDKILGIVDLALAAASFTTMLVLRYDGSVDSDAWNGLVQFLPLALLTVLVSNGAWGLYGHLWKHASLYEARLLAVSGTTIAALLTVFEWRTHDVPISVVIAGSMLLTFLMSLVRFQRRLFSYRRETEGPGRPRGRHRRRRCRCRPRGGHAPQSTRRVHAGCRARRRPRPSRPLLHGRSRIRPNRGLAVGGSTHRCARCRVRHDQRSPGDHPTRGQPRQRPRTSPSRSCLACRPPCAAARRYETSATSRSRICWDATRWSSTSSQFVPCCPGNVC